MVFNDFLTTWIATKKLDHRKEKTDDRAIASLPFGATNVIHDSLFAIEGSRRLRASLRLAKIGSAAGEMFHNAFFAIVHVLISEIGVHLYFDAIIKLCKDEIELF